MIDCGPIRRLERRAASPSGTAAGRRGCGTSSRRMHARVAAEPGVGLDAHLVRAVELVEVVDVHRPEVGLERARRRRRAARPSSRPSRGRCSGRSAARRPGTCSEPSPGRSPGRFGACVDDRLRPLLEHLQPDAFAVLDLHLEPAGEAEPLDRRRHDARGSSASCICAELRLEPGDQRVLLQFRRRPLRPVGPGGERRRPVRGVRAVEQREAAEDEPVLDAPVRARGTPCSSAPSLRACGRATRRPAVARR